MAPTLVHLRPVFRSGGQSRRDSGGTFADAIAFEDGFDVLGVALAEGFRANFRGRKNELFRRTRFDRNLAFVLDYVQIALSLGYRMRFRFRAPTGGRTGLGLALGLKRLKLLQRFVEGALQPLFVEAEVREGLGVVAKDARGGQGSVNLRVFCLDPAGFFDMTQREHRVFDGTHAVQTPLGIAEGLGILTLDGRFGREIRHEFGAEAI